VRQDREFRAFFDRAEGVDGQDLLTGAKAVPQSLALRPEAHGEVTSDYQALSTWVVSKAFEVEAEG
jgi:hypothetical protein